MEVMTIKEFLHKPARTSIRWNSIALLGPMESITEASESIKEFTSSTKDFFKAVSKIIHYITHPAELGMSIWGGIVKYSLPVCLIMCILALLFYLMGYDKAKKFISGSFFGYIVIQMVNAAI